MSENTIVSENTPAREAPKPKSKRKPGKKDKAAKKAKPGKKPATERANKKAEVITMMKRAKGATLAEIMKPLVPGLVSILGSKGGRRSRYR